MRKNLKWPLIVILSLLVLFFLYKKMSKGTGAEKVSTEKAEKRTITETVSANGKIYPENEVKIIPEFSGKVENLKVAEGDTVKKGQLLATVGGRSSLTSPIKGTVLSLSVKEGENVTGNSFNKGSEIMTIADMGVLEVRTEVGENDVIKIHNGDSAMVEVDAYPNQQFKGVVVSIANSVKTQNMMASQNDITSYEVRVRLVTESYVHLLGYNRIIFRPGMNARVEIKTQRKENVVSVPIISVSARSKMDDKTMDELKNQSEDKQNTAQPVSEEVVFVLEKDGTVKKVIVESGIQDLDYIELKQGLKEGEEVITGPYSAISQRLKTGTKVKVVPKDKLFDK